MTIEDELSHHQEPFFLEEGTTLKELIDLEIKEEYEKIDDEIFIFNKPGKSLYQKIDVLRIFTLFCAVAVNKFIGPDWRIATPDDIPKILENRDLRKKLEQCDINLALVLKNTKKGVPNEYLARHLARQIRKRKGKKFELPVMVSLCDLELVRNSKSPYDLSFQLREDARIINSPFLNRRGYFWLEDLGERKGLPKIVKKTRRGGDRYLFTIDHGLRILALRGGKNLDSSYPHLSHSGNNILITRF